MNLTFCKNCKYFKVIYGYMYSDEKCKSPKNITLEKNYYKPYKKYYELPKDINKDNNCELYKLKLSIKILGFLKWRKNEYTLPIL